MINLSIKIKDGKTKFLPGEEIRGEVMWNLEQVPEKIEVNLFWFTEGKGKSDSEIVSSIELDAAVQSGKQPFNFQLPLAPHSFYGKHISLRWAIEVLAACAERNICDFVMSPLDSPVSLKSIETPLPKILNFLSKLKQPGDSRPGA